MGGTVIVPGPHRRNLLIAFLFGVGFGAFITVSLHYFNILPRPPTEVAAPQG